MLEGRERTMTFRDAEGRCVPVIYGVTRCGAHGVFGRTDSSQRYTYVAYLFCEGPINSISNIRIDGYTPEELGLVLNTTYRVYLGTSSQTVDPIISGFDANWVSGHPGSAYMTAKFDGIHPLAGRVDIEAIQVTIEGMLVRDPRTDPTLVNRYYRANPTLAHADWLTNNRYGMNWPDTRLRWSGSITESANDDDANLSSRPSAPTNAPTVAHTVDLVNYSPLFNTYVYNWVYTWVVNGVESPPSPASTNYTYDLNTDFKRVTVTLQNGPGGTSAKRIYRRVNSGAYNLELVISDNTTTSFDVVIADSQLTTTQPPPSAPIPRYAIGIWMGEQASADDWNETFRATHAAFMTYDGQYDIWVDKARSASALTFDASNIIGEPEIETVGLAQIYSKVTVHFTNKDAGFKNDRATVEHPSLALPPNESEREEKREGDFRLFSVPSYDQGMRLAKLKFNRSRRALRISFLTNAKGVRALPGLVVSVTHPVGPLSNTLVTVTAVTPLQGGEIWRIQGEFYSAADYSDTIQVNPSPVVPGVPSPFLAPPRPSSVTATEVVTTASGMDGPTISRIKVNWTNAATPWLKSTQVWYTDGNNTVKLGDFVGGPAYIESPRLGVTYTVVLYTETITGQLSPSASVTVTPTGQLTLVQGDPAGPVIPPVLYESITASAGKVSWPTPQWIARSVNADGSFKTWDTTFWTNTNFGAFDGTRVNNNSSSAVAFNMNVALTRTLVLDLGAGNAKQFNGFRILYDPAKSKPDSLGIWYSDDNIAWTDVSGVTWGYTVQWYFTEPSDLSAVGEVVLAYYDFGSGVGAHRYWRIRTTDATAQNCDVYEVQPLEFLGAKYPYPMKYQVYVRQADLSTYLLAEDVPVPAPTAASPLDVRRHYVRRTSGALICDGVIRTVSTSGLPSGVTPSLGFGTLSGTDTPVVLAQATGSNTKQSGANSNVEGEQRAGRLTSQDGASADVVEIDGSAANTAADPLIKLKGTGTGIYYG